MAYACRNKLHVKTSHQNSQRFVCHNASHAKPMHIRSLVTSDAMIIMIYDIS